MAFPVVARLFKLTELAVTVPVTVRLPAEDNDIVSAAAAEAAVLKLNLVALLEELKSPSDTAAIPAATNMASVPVASSGA